MNDGYLGSGIVFLRALKKYGKENFKREILEFAENADELNELERKYVTLNEVNDKMCYNMKTGGDRWEFSEESLKQMSESHKGKPGHPLSEEVRQKLSETNKGRTFSEEHKKKLSESHKGKHHSEETKQKISEANKGNEKLKYWTGKIFSDEHRQHISKANKGKPHLSQRGKSSWNKGMKMSDEFKEKCRNSALGKTFSDETKKKMSDAHKLRAKDEEYKKHLSDAMKNWWKNRRGNMS